MSRHTAHRRRQRHGAVVGLVLLAAGLSSCTTAPAEQSPATDAAPATSSPEVGTATPRSGDSSGPSANSSGSPTQDPDPDATAGGQERPVDAGALVEQFRVEVRDGTVQPPRTDIEVPVGDTIELAVTTDVAGTLRVAELGMARDLPAGEETVVPVTVKQAGRFEVLLDGVLIALVTTP